MQQTTVTNYKVYVVGSNIDDDLINTNELRELSCINKQNVSIKQIYPADRYYIYSNNSECGNKRHWAVGDNKHAGCCIDKKIKFAKAEKINYFDQHNINIKKLCVDMAGSSTFWITQHDIAYANGYNFTGQLGLSHYNNIYEPQLIELNNKEIIDIHSAFNYSIALCRDGNKYVLRMIIAKWIKQIQLNNTLIPEDIIHIIMSFYSCREPQVYITNANGSLKHSNNKEPIKAWKYVDELKGKNIVSIKTGYKHSLFLESNGLLWSSGESNRWGQLGYSPSYDLYDFFSLSKLSTTFWQQAVALRLKVPSVRQSQKFILPFKVKIKEMACGCSHNLAIDCNGNVYSWGRGCEGQLGNGSRYDSGEGTVIGYFATANCNVCLIGCGFYHSYCMTQNGKHYLFGSNSCNECITFDKKYCITTPYCINETIVQKCNGKTI